MKFLFRFLVKTTFLVAMVFVFLVLFQFGPEGFTDGAQQEWEQWQSLAASVQEAISERTSAAPSENPVNPVSPVNPGPSSSPASL